jgi:hypothetical protein
MTIYCVILQGHYISHFQKIFIATLSEGAVREFLVAMEVLHLENTLIFLCFSLMIFPQEV